MTVLQPVTFEGQIVPNVFEDVTCPHEPGYSRQKLPNGSIVYSHQSGYGFLSENQVLILETPVL